MFRSYFPRGQGLPCKTSEWELQSPVGSEVGFVIRGTSLREHAHLLRAAYTCLLPNVALTNAALVLQDELGI